MAKGHLIDCTFCGDQQVPQGKEDVIPHWLARKLAHYRDLRYPGTQASYVDYSFSSLQDFYIGAVRSSRTIGAVPTAFHLPDVCIECNRGWMSALEEASKRLIPGLLEGKPKLLAAFDQFVLSMWAIKTSLTYDASQTLRWIPPKHGTMKLFRLGYPLPGASVMVGNDPNHVMEGGLAHGRKDMGLEITTNMHAARFTFQFDRLLLKTHINYGDDFPEQGELLPGLPPSPPYFHQIWPPVPRYVWPSKDALIRRRV